MKPNDTKPQTTSSRCRIISSCGFTFCLTCHGNDYDDDRPFACGSNSHNTDERFSRHGVTKA